jgi:ankyrin repeat protein
MKTIKIILLIIAFTNLSTLLHAQEMPDNMLMALRTDDTTKLGSLITKENVNECYGNYSLLSNAIRANAQKCFNLIIAKGADVSKACNGYVPPLMHAAKYGHLEMVKILVAKGANVYYKYNGSDDFTNGPAPGETPLTYAEKYNRTDIVEYLKTLITK